MQHILLKIKSASQNIFKHFLVSEVFNKKCHFQCAFDDNLSVYEAVRIRVNGTAS
jgi:hypothetical protein